MAATCPIYTSQEWVDLESALGFADALTAFSIYGEDTNNTTPLSVNKAKELLKVHRVMDADERHVRDSVAFKRDRIKAEGERLAEAATSPKLTAAQKRTMDVLLKNNEDYQQMLQEDVDRFDAGIPLVGAISVTKFIGSSDYTGAKNYEEFKKFGTYMHKLLEDLQEEGNKQGRSSADVLTRAYFDAHLQDVRERDKTKSADRQEGFDVEDLSDELLFEMAQGMATLLQKDSKSRALILPEVTLMAKAKFGENVVGRLDLLIVDTDGNIKIFDFKTKKVTDAVENNVLNPDKAREKLATSAYLINSVDGTAANFQMGMRTTYDTWVLQTKTYENMLRQLGLSVSGSEILSLLYQASELPGNRQRFDGYALEVFSGNNYYTSAGAGAKNAIGIPLSEAGTTKRLLDFRKKVDEMLPITEEQEKESARALAQQFAFDMSEADERDLLEKMGKFADQELERAYDTMRLHPKGSPLSELAKARIASITAFRDTINSKGNITSSLKVRFVTDALQAEIKSALDLSLTAHADYLAGKNTAKASEVLRQAYARMQELVSIFDMTRSIIRRAVDDEEITHITSESEVVKSYDRMDADRQRIEERFRQVALDQMISVIQQQIGEKGYELVSREYQDAVNPKIENLQARIDKLRQGLPDSLYNQLTGHVVSLMNKVKKDLVLRDQDAKTRSEVSAIEALEAEMTQMRLIRDTGFSYKREDIQKYIEGISDTTNKFFVGQSDAFDKGFLSSLRLDGFQAGITNSDQLLYAFVSRLKQASADAVAAAQENLQVLKVDAALTPLVEEKGEAGATKSITETRTLKRVNPETGEVEESTQEHFIKPDAIAYEQQRKDFTASTRVARKEIETALAEVNSIPRLKNETKGDWIARIQASAEHQTWLEKLAAREELLDEIAQWEEKYQHRPMVDAFYSIQQKLPADLREKIQRNFKEIELLQKSSGGKGNEELYEPEDQDRIQELEIEIKKLRREARDQNLDYQAYLDDLEKFFVFTPNMPAYERALRAKEREYADRPDLLEKWHAQNTILAPMKDWHNQLNDLYEQIGELLGAQDETMSELFAKRSQLMAPYRRDGEFDPTFLTPEDAKALMEAEFAINQYRKNAQENQTPIEDDVKEQLKSLTTQINGLRRKVENPFYRRNMEEKSQMLLRRRDDFLRAQKNVLQAKATGDPAVVAKAEQELKAAGNDFLLYEQEFQSWYEMNHVAKYDKRFLKTGRDPRSGAVPKSFNFDNAPTLEREAEFLESRPRGKWNRRDTTEAALNSEYEEHFQLADGTPLPKSLRIDNGIVSVIPGTDTRYVNPRYQELTRDSTAFNFYNVMMPYYFERQKSITGRAPGYLVPGGEANFVQLAKHKDIKGALSNYWKNFVDENLSGKASENDLASNIYGDAGDRVRLKYNNPLSEGKQSPDAINNLIKWCAESHYNEAMSDAQPVADSMIDYLKLELKNLTDRSSGSAEYTKRAADLAQLIKLMEFERRKFISGQVSDGSNRTARKLMGKVFGYTAFARIAFDLANQTKNYASGALQTFMAARHDENAHYTRSDMGWAMQQQMGGSGFFKDYLSDWGKLSDLSVNTQMYRRFNPAQHDFEKYLDDTTGTRNRRLQAKLFNITELAHLVQEKGDSAISQMTWLAVMNHYQFRVLDATGQPLVTETREDGTPVYKTVKAHEAYALDNQNRLVIKADVEYTREDERRLREIVHSEVRKAQGNYAQADKTQFESTMIGQIMNFFRKYLVPQVQTRLGHLRPNWEGREVHYGYLRAIAAVFKYYGPAEMAKHLVLGGYTPNWIKGSKLNSFYSRKIGHASRDIISATVLSVISMLLLNYIKGRDDDDEPIGFWAGNAIRVVWGVKQETVSMNPFPIVGGADDYIKNFTSFTTMTRELTNIPKILTHLLATMYASTVGGWGEEPGDNEALYQLAYDKAYYQRSEGAYEAGDFKLEKDFSDLTGLKNVRNFLNPDIALDTAKKFQ